MGRPDLGRVLGWVLLCVLAVVPSSASSQIARTEVGHVVFEGNESFRSDSLARAIVTRQTECRSAILSPFCALGTNFAVQRFYLRDREIPNDTLRLRTWYYQRGFREAEVDATITMEYDGRAAVTFLVREGDPVTVASIAFEGVESLDDDGLLDGLPLQPGDRLDLFALDATRKVLEERLANRGHARVEVLLSNWIPSGTYRAEVTFEIDPGPAAVVGPITVIGNEQLSESTVLNTLQFQTGDVYRLDDINEARARLFGLEILRSAAVTVDLTTETDSIVPVTVRVDEGDAYRVRPGAGLTTAECFDLEARWTARNFIGGGRVLQVRGRMANILAAEFHDLLCPLSGTGSFAKLTGLASIDFVQPWILSTRNSFNASLFAERQSLPDIFIREAVGIEVALTRSIAPQTPLTVSYRPELTRLDAAEILFCTGLLICDPDDISVLGGANWLAPLGLSFTRSTANNILNPSSGYTLVLDVEHAAGWTGSNFRYDRLVTEATWYSRPGVSSVFAARLRGGWVGAEPFGQLLGRSGSLDIVHPQKRFYAGGANSVRGFAQSRLGPRVLTVDPEDLLSVGEGGGGCTPEALLDLSCDANAVDGGFFLSRPTGGTRVLEGSVEARFGLGTSFEGVIFTDVGQVWGPTDGVDLAALEVTPGFGARYLSPIGPIRLDLGYRFRGGEHLSVVTTQVAPYDPSSSDTQITVDGGLIPYVKTEQLAVLTPLVLFGQTSAWSFRRLQLHVSIGQAF